MERNVILRSCFDKALYALATARVFSIRASEKDAWLKANTCLGILLPSFVGGIVLTYGKDVEKLDKVIWIVGALGIIQLILSIIAVVFAWEESKNYYIESSISNRNLFESFQDLVKLAPQSDETLKIEYDKLVMRESLRNDLDDKYPFTLKEERKGMRYALRYFQRHCATCNEVPITMKPTNCDTCGNF
jgi:mobilome CxxCx(11)CxxC protein